MSDSFSTASCLLQQHICGVGIDIVEISRIREKIAGNRAFLKRVFTEEELKYSLGKKNQYQRLAVRFAAKEAVWKAVGLKGLALKDIGIVKAPDMAKIFIFQRQ